MALRLIIHYYELTLGIASTFNWSEQLFWIHYSLAVLLCNENKLEDAYAHITQAERHAANHTYPLGRAMEVQAWVRGKQRRPEDATPKDSFAVEIFEKLGAAKDLERCKAFLRDIKQPAQSPGYLWWI